ncbi:hybrid sensor histidine kinase/response regulator [Polaribacter vadi]|uniref:hybrid sensor histidine kinase/response regulator n=1 Tax=Polaribacter TaxID=52959 RepID=UPI001C0A265E|nr:MULTISPECIES: ATP-binding protein [Polaribacter]MBU3010382.1 hybrid sensor histidine kinase/response regulator [Polaribacter vadi]MDO6740189.1 hybrid sensor histidine kinase/response regulator [Polaribacter sp. 1_MG-2023]
MKSLKQKFTFKVIIGYITLSLLAVVSGFLVLSEIKTFTQLQKQDVTDRNVIVKTGTLIANIYKNESLARAALQFNSREKFNEYLTENKKLISRLDSLNLSISNNSQEFILDSIKLIIDKKLKNVIDLHNLNRKNDTDESINNAINKLTSIDSLLVQINTNDFVNNQLNLDNETKLKLEDYTASLDKNTPKDSITKLGETEIDTLVSISKRMLKEAKNKNDSRRFYLQRKQKELIKNDLTISRKLYELLDNLEKDIILYTTDMNNQREETINGSRKIILLAAAISFIIIIFFSIIILNDYWKTQRYRNQLEKANSKTTSLLKSREQLISMVSHDLRTPINTISGFSELLQKTTQSTKDKNYIDHIRRASGYMGQLVNDLLEFSTLENGNITIESIPFNLENSIDEISENAKTFIKNKPVTIIVKHDKLINKLIISDPFRIKQILSNLIINACKFTQEGTITIESFLKNNTLEIKVKDTGIGISKDQKENIFKAFNQAENKNNTIKGFGLGLTISKKLTELLKGSLTLESKIDVGSTFTLKLPVTLSKKRITNIKEAKNSIATFNLTAIIVEDDASLRQLLEDFLKQLKIKPILFKNAQDAIKSIDKIAYSFVLTDIQLPKMNGIHFMETLKNSTSYKQQPVFAMTGRENITKEDLIKSGFSDVLIKPFNSKKLQNTLLRFFDANITDLNSNINNNEEKTTEGFNLKTLNSFLNNDADAVNNTLQTFLKDTENNSILLKNAQEKKDIYTLNEVSHKMLSMFKQLEIKTVIPHLELFETANSFDDEVFTDFIYKLNTIVTSIKKYLN